MALLYVDSFDTYTAAQASRRWNGTANPRAIGAGGRNGTNALQMGGDVVNSRLAKDFPITDSVGIVGIATKPTGAMHAGSILIAFQDGTNTQVDLRLDAVGHLYVTRNGTTLATATSILLLDTWYYLEFKVTINSSTGTVDVRANGSDVPELSGLTGLNTQATANAYWNRLFLGPTYSNTVVYYDDLYVLDGSAGLNSFLGDIRVEARVPNGAGNYSEWAPYSGEQPYAGPNYECVDEAQANDDTDYVSSATAEQRDSYAMTNLATTSGSVLAVAVNRTSRKDDAGSRHSMSFIRVNGANYPGADKNESDSYTHTMDIWEKNPNTTNPWGISEVNAVEAGTLLVS